MVLVRDLMTKGVVTVGPYTTLRDLVSVLRREEVSGVAVISGDKVVGVVSVTDLLEFEATTPGVPADQPGQVEWGEVEIQEDLGAEEEEPPAFFYMDMWPDVGTDVLERFEEVRGPEWDILEEHVVAEVMTQRVRAIEPDRSVRDAARLMTTAGIHRVLVMEDEQLQGVLSASDVVRAVATGRL